MLSSLHIEDSVLSSLHTGENTLSSLHTGDNMFSSLHIEDNMFSSLHTPDNIVVITRWGTIIVFSLHNVNNMLSSLHTMRQCSRHYTLWDNNNIITVVVITHCGTILELSSLHSVKQWLEPETFLLRDRRSTTEPSPLPAAMCSPLHTVVNIAFVTHLLCNNAALQLNTMRENPSLTATPKNRLPSL